MLTIQGIFKASKFFWLSGKGAGPYEPEYDKDYRENEELNCSLESFAGWEIELFVNAGAIEENGKYRDSEEGQHYKVKVSERLEIPADLSVSLTDEEDKILFSIRNTRRMILKIWL